MFDKLIAALKQGRKTIVFTEGTDHRIQAAAERLLKTDDQISEIALDCGFRDSNYFSRQFRKRYGVSPRAFRNG